MRFLLLLIALLISGSAYSQNVLTTTGGVTVQNSGGTAVAVGNVAASYVGQVATASGMPNKLNTTASNTLVTRKAHYARADITRVKLAYPNWYVSTIGNGIFGQEVATGNAVTVRSWIEYPVGSYTQVTFASASSVSIADKTTTWSDFTNVTIPNGALFYELTSITATSGNNFPYQDPGNAVNNSPLATQYGEKAYLGNSPPGLPANNFATNTTQGKSAYYAAAIVGDTNAPTFCLLGDSRSQANYDNGDPTYDLGNMARSVGPTYAYINFGVSGDRVAGFFFGGALRMAILNASNCTNIVDELGANDYVLTANTTTAQWQAMKQMLGGRFNGRKYARTTMEPVTTSTDNFATVGGQTGAAFNGNITTSNQWVRSPGDSVPYVDLSTAVSSAQDSGLWAANGYPYGYTRDGTHETQSGNILIRNSGLLNPTTLANQSVVSTTYPSMTFTGVSSPSYVTGTFGNAISLPSGKQGTALGYAPGQGPAQIECWVKNPTAALQPLCGGGAFQIYSYPTTCLATLHAANTYTNSSTSLCDGNWHYLVATASNSGATITYNLYVDCVLGATKTNATTTPSGWSNNLGVQIGAASGLAATIDEVAMWATNPADTSCTIPVAPYVGNEAGLVGVWHLDGNLDGVQGPAGM